MVTSLSVNRRKFMLVAGGATAGAASGLVPAVALADDKAMPDYAAWKDKDALIVHTANTMETRREAMGAPSITPSDELYIRNNLPAPPTSIADDPDAWEIAIEGVKNPATVTLGDLKPYGVHTVACVLQCSGNGRLFFAHETSGTQWGVGAAGNVMWTGIPFKTVVDAMGGPAEGMKYLTGTGGEELPAGIDPTTIMVERSVPIEALDEALIVYEMNGEVLPVAHGGPARLVAPG
ncbi:MAG: molybdopterin-dependent oxidoreductase, partial [Pseudomonadota bacterium]